MKILSQNYVQDLLNVISYTDPRSGFFNDKDMQAYSIYSGFLEIKRHEILNIDNSLDLSDILVSSYFWFIKLQKLFLSKHEDTIGFFESQSTDMLLRFYSELGNTVDWSIFEKIEKGALEETGIELFVSND
jgi:hypothetical protein